MNSRIRKPSRIFWFVLVLCTLGTALVSLGIGRFPISPVKTGGILLSHLCPISPFWEPREEAIVTLIRLPRILGALGAGAGLSVAGAALQGIFRNPLVGPQIIGVSTGAGFGGALGIMIAGSTLSVISSAFLFGLLAMVLVWGICYKGGKGSLLALILAGVVVSAFFTSLTSLLKYVADPYDKLPAIVMWLMGSFSTVTYEKLALGPARHSSSRNSALCGAISDQRTLSGGGGGGIPGYPSGTNQVVHSRLRHPHRLRHGSPGGHRGMGGAGDSPHGPSLRGSGPSASSPRLRPFWGHLPSGNRRSRPSRHGGGNSPGSDHRPHRGPLLRPAPSEKTEKRRFRVTVIKANNLGFRYSSGSWIFKNYSFSLERGKALAILGPQWPWKDHPSALPSGNRFSPKAEPWLWRVP